MKPNKAPLATITKVWIVIGSILSLTAIIFVGYIIYAAIISNAINECIPENNYCHGVWPFEKTYTTSYPCGSGTPQNNGNGINLNPCIEPDAKPIIYLYPESTTEATVTLGHPEKLLVSYPEYKDGWHVIAEPDGTLIDSNNGRELYSLYWEGDDGLSDITEEGFVVAGSDTAGFLEEKLAVLGLNAKETEEFIIYWLPQLQINQYNYIRFATSEEIENYMPLQITPTPNITIRIYMVASSLDAPISVKEQILPKTPTRSGFTVVEWGGTLSHSNS